MSAVVVGDSDQDGIVTERDGGVLSVRLDRTHKRNALDRAAQLRLLAVLTDAALDETLRVIHLTGSGEHFCAGSDWVATSRAGADAPRPRPGGLVRRLPVVSHRLVELLLTIQVPVVASVRGTAAGLGCQLALASDFALAATDSVFWSPFVQRGFTPDSGATWLLPRLVGLARARRMLLLGEKVPGDRAADWGLIHDAVPAGELAKAADDLVARLATGPTVALGLTRQQLLRSAESPLSRALVDEAHALELAARTSDFREGLAAFEDRRDPDFEGR